MKFSEEKADILKEVINQGIGEAAMSLSELLGKMVRLNTPELLFFDAEELKQWLNEQQQEEGRYVCVSQELKGSVSGTGVVVFPYNDGKTMADLLLDDITAVEEKLTVSETEAIEEVGNMVIASVGAAINEMTGIEIQYRLPMITITDKLILIPKMTGNLVYCIAKTFFTIKEINGLRGYIILILTYQGIENILKRLEY